jgi:hypothetical protein
MQPFSFLSVLALTGLALALDFENWHPPGPGDVRGPCPALNSLANHALIPHNGKNLTVPLLVQVMGEVFNISPELATIVSSLGLLTAPNPSAGSFDLDNLDKHNAFEHDASLSRADFALGGDDHTFRPDIFAKFIAFFDGMENVTIPVAAAARYSRVLDSRKHNPNFTYGVQQQITSYGETVKYFRTMVDPKTGATPVEFVKILFGRFFAVVRPFYIFLFLSIVWYYMNYS